VAAVPMSALVKEHDETFDVLFVDGKALRRPIEIGLDDGTRGEVVSGRDGTEVSVTASGRDRGRDSGTRRGPRQGPNPAVHGPCRGRPARSMTLLTASTTSSGSSVGML
jgi:hypothetical protein